MADEKKDKPRSQSLHSAIKTTKYMLGFIWKEKHGKLYLLLKGIMSLLNGVFPLSYAIMPGLIINELTGEQRINIIILYVALLTVTPIINQLIHLSMDYQLEKIRLELNLNMTADFCAHVATMDYETLEKPDVQIIRERAANTLNQFTGVVDNLGNLLSAVFSVIAMSSIIITLNPFIIILIIVVITANSLITKRMNHKNYLIGLEASKNWMRRFRVMQMFWDFQYAKEFRLFNLKAFVMNKFLEDGRNGNKLQLKTNMMWQKTSIFSSATNPIQQIVIYSYLIYSVIARGLAIGSMTIYLTATERFSGFVRQVMDSYLQFSQRSLVVQEMIDFMNIPLRQHETGCF